MSAADAKRALSDIPEAAVITRLLSEVTRTLPSSIPGTVAAVPMVELPAAPPPPVAIAPPVAPPPPVARGPQATSGVVPVGVLAVADFFALVNWKNRPEEAKPLPAVAPDRPPGHEWTVEAVMSAFFGD